MSIPFNLKISTNKYQLLSFAARQFKYSFSRSITLLLNADTVSSFDLNYTNAKLFVPFDLSFEDLTCTDVGSIPALTKAELRSCSVISGCKPDTKTLKLVI